MKVRLVTLCLPIILFLGCSENLVEERSEQIEAEKITLNLVTRNLIFRYEITNKANRFLSSADVRIALPVIKSARHSLNDFTINHPYKLESDSLGNQTLLLSFDSFAPYSTKIITVKAKLLDLESEQIIDASEPLFLSETKFVPFSRSEFKAVNLRVKGSSTLNTITQAYNWVVAHMSYSGYLPNDYGALYALQKARGDCTEYMYLLAALLRANDVPTRLVAGYVYQGHHLVEAADYHNWVEVFYQGKWQVVDALRERFLGGNMDYIAIRYLDSEEGHIHQSQKFSASSSLVIRLF